MRAGSALPARPESGTERQSPGSESGLVVARTGAWQIRMPVNSNERSYGNDFAGDFVRCWIIPSY